MLSLLKLVLQHKLLLPLWVKVVVNGLCPVQAHPALSPCVPEVEDTEGVRLGKDVHVGQVAAGEGELHSGHGCQGLAGGEVVLGRLTRPALVTLHLLGALLMVLKLNTSLVN